MPSGLPVLHDVLGTLSLVALLAFAYGACHQACRSGRMARGALGGLFGLVAALQMSNALAIADGVVVDLRNLPLTLAGAFLGWPGALVSAIIAAVARIHLGGVGTLAGCASIALAAGGGLAWVWWVGTEQRRWHSFLTLGVLSSVLSYGVICVLLPTEVAIRFATLVWPAVSLIHIPAVVAIGSLLERERQRIAEVARLHAEVRHDPLTGLLNRRGFERHVAGLKPRWGSVGLLILDLDHFKRLNDRHGHAAGDLVLRELGPLLARLMPEAGAVARLGGEEFAIHLHDVTAEQVAALAEGICEVVRTHPFAAAGATPLAVTVSIGAAWSASSSILSTLLARADFALYEAKRRGRDRAMTYQAVANTFGSDVPRRADDPLVAPARDHEARGLRALWPTAPAG